MAAPPDRPHHDVARERNRDLPTALKPIPAARNHNVLEPSRPHTPCLPRTSSFDARTLRRQTIERFTSSFGLNHAGTHLRHRPLQRLPRKEISGAQAGAWFRQRLLLWVEY